MITKTVNLYQFDELSDKAKEKARAWWRTSEAELFGVYGELCEPAETAAKILGITFDQQEVKLTGGGTRSEPKIYWSLHVQGSGASFAGSYAYARGCSKAIRAEFGDTVLHDIADRLTALQKRHGYKLKAQITTDGREVHEYAMDFEITKSPVPYGPAHLGQQDDGYETLVEILRDFARWIYKGIDEEYDYRMTEEYVDDSIRANEYTFTEDGKRED